MSNTQPPTYDEKLKETIRQASTSYTDSEAKWLRLAQDGATDQQILAQIKREIGYGGGRGGPDIYCVRHRPNPLSLEIGESHSAPPFLILQGAALVTALRIAWGISTHGAEQPTLFDQTPFMHTHNQKTL